MTSPRDFHNQKHHNPFFNRRGVLLFKRAAETALAVAVFSGILYLVFYHPFFRLNDFVYPNIPETQRAAVEAHLKNVLSGKTFLLFPNDHYFFVKSDAIRNSIMAALPELKDVRVVKKMHQLEISVVDRQPIFRLLVGERIFLLDQDGKGLREATSKTDGENLIAIAAEKANFIPRKQMLKPDWVPSLTNLHKYFATQTGIRDRLIKIDEERQVVEVITSEGWYAVFDPYGDIKSQLGSLETVLTGKFNSENRKTLDYIDVRFGDKVFTKQKQSI
jgi:cell division septal protein FtsQ